MTPQLSRDGIGTFYVLISSRISQLTTSYDPVYTMFMVYTKSKDSHLRYNVVLRPEPEGGFTVLVPALPGCVTYGRNLTEAKKMAADAIEGYLVSLEKHHEAIPSEDKSLITSIRIKRSPLKKKNLIHA